MRHLWYILVSLRPKQWIKNISVFIAIFIGGRLFQIEDLEKVSLTFIVFCAASSAMYLLNDVVDRNKDRYHPVKKNRPISSGKLSPLAAILAALLLVIVAVWLSVQVHPALIAMVTGYIILQLAYSLIFKRTIIIDAMLIAVGFVIRVYAGAFVISEPLSAWLLLAVAAAAWFLALGKRRSELTLMGHRVASEHRQTLLHYPAVLLDSLTTMSATATVVFYAMFTFLSQKQGLEFLSPFLPLTLEAPKLMMITIPLVIYGVARYLYIIYEKKEASSPETALLRDIPLLSTLAVLILVMFIVIYGLNLA